MMSDFECLPVGTAARLAELDALLLLARDAIVIAGYGTRMAPEVRDTLLQIDTALKEGQR
jgi:hypothetical protein